MALVKLLPPVVAASAGANPSTAGDAAVLVDPDSPDAFAAAIEAGGLDRTRVTKRWVTTMDGRRRACHVPVKEVA